MPDRVSSELERNPDDKIILGVCSGLADYFTIDPVLVRVGFVVSAFLTGGVMVLIYLLLAILMPEKSEHSRHGRTTQASGTPEDDPDISEDAWPDNSGTNRRPDDAQRRRQVAGMLLIGLGALILAANLGAFRWFSFGTYWPVLLILVGLLLVIATLRGGRRRD